MTLLSNIITPTNVLTTTNTQTVTNKTFGDNPTFSAGTANGVTFLNGSKVLTSGSALTFNGAQLGVVNASGTAILKLDGSSAPEIDFVSSGVVKSYIYAPSTSLQLNTVGANPIIFLPNEVEGMRLTSTGLGIGTSSPSTKLAVAGGISGTGAINISGGGWGVLPYVANSLVIDNNGGETRFFATGANATTDGSFLFYTSQTDGGANERARIDSSGNLLVGLTSQVGAGTICTVNSATKNGVVVKDSASGSYLYSGLNSSNSSVLLILGSGNVQNANNSYGAISDVKLKENIVDATPKLDKLMQVRVRNYNLKGDYEQHKQIGVIAQELETVFPAMVDETPDKDEEGNDLGTTTKSVKYSVFVPMLIKAIQEQQAIISAQATVLESLKARLDAANV